MRLASLFSGGKDSCYALHRAMLSKHEIMCLIALQSENPESFMFHTPNIKLTELQAESIGIPLLAAKTKGEKEKELKDLKDAISKAKQLFKVEGIVTGAIESVYQATRIQKICDSLGLWCFNPLWQSDQVELLNELLENKFEAIISAVSAYPLDEKWLGRKIDRDAIRELAFLKEKYKINPAGEGGEYESLVLKAPFFRKKLVIEKAQKEYKSNSGSYRVKEAVLH